MSSSLPCWHCGASYEVVEGGLPFRADCGACGRYLHCCKNCKHHKRGLPNECRIPETEQIADREQFNFCEEFSPLGEQSDAGGSLSDAAKKLFGDSDEEDAGPKGFDSLFKD